MRRVGMVAACAALVVPLHAAAETRTEAARTRLGSCFLQEVHAPFPSVIIENSLPAGWQPAPYGSAQVDDVGDSVTTMISCRLGKREVQETWSWVATIPPGPYRSKNVDVYGFLIKAFAERGAPTARAERKCLRYVFEPARIEVTKTDAGDAQIAHSTTEGEFSDEMRTEVARPAADPRRVRLFAQGTRGIAGFDFVTKRGTTRTGSGSYVQRGGSPDVSDGVAVPGYFAGDALTVDGASLSLEAAGRHTCTT